MSTPYRRLVIVALAVPCLGAAPAPTHGDITLDYRGLAECPGEAALRERTADMFDFQDPFVPPGASGSLRIRITLDRIQPGSRPRAAVVRQSPGSTGGPRFHADLEVVDSGGATVARTAEEHVDCDALVWLLSHRLRLAIPAVTMASEVGKRVKTLEQRVDRLEVESRATRQSVADLEKRSQPPASAPAKPPVPPPEPPKQKPGWSFVLGAGALMTAGLTATVGPGAWLDGQARNGALGLGFEFRTVLPSRMTVGIHDFDLSQFTLLLSSCLKYSIAFGCAVAGGGIQIHYERALGPATWVPFIQFGGRIGVEVPLGDTGYAARAWTDVIHLAPNSGWIYSDGNGQVTNVRRPDVSAFFGLGGAYRF